MSCFRSCEGRWFRGEFGNFRWVLYNVFDRPGGAPTGLQLTFSLTETSDFDSSGPRESYDRGSSCKISERVKRTWAFLIFFALNLWLTWYQVVDHVCYSQSNMAKGICLIDDSLNTKVSPFFDTPFPSSYWPRTKSTSSIKHAHQPLPTIDPPPHRLPKDNIDKVRCHKLFSDYARSIGSSRNMYLIYLPIRPCLSTWWRDDSSSESSTPCNLPSYEPIQAWVR